MTYEEPQKIPCPLCGSQWSRTLKTRWRPAIKATWRRRICADCGARFSSHETLIPEEPAIRLNPGRLASTSVL